MQYLDSRALIVLKKDCFHHPSQNHRFFRERLMNYNGNREVGVSFFDFARYFLKLNHFIRLPSF